eukprot:15550626-Heterocapsa_arctica.AAC.1
MGLACLPNGVEGARSTPCLHRLGRHRCGFCWFAAFSLGESLTNWLAASIHAFLPFGPELPSLMHFNDNNNNMSFLVLL